MEFTDPNSAGELVHPVPVDAGAADDVGLEAEDADAGRSRELHLVAVARSPASGTARGLRALSWLCILFRPASGNGRTWLPLQGFDELPSAAVPSHSEKGRVEVSPGKEKNVPVNMIRDQTKGSLIL
ncbi:hypothetical protein PR202_ga13288 [Eleusine coracana subsp. coracana]|uniref:Uncharacterized protein n=1 Tax=Eleusine coracana subsp. coracana TaxID=191504 RepID=A0AAV5CDX5_ELECO|nr:hypothetical protein PR202_ga13288 [Eleusine coracana subsp. coracana]